MNFFKLANIAIIIAFFGMAACTKSSTPGSVTPIQSVGCAVESAVTSAAATTIAASISCSNQAQIATDIQNALGNVNLCAAGVAPAPAALVGPKWSKVGDVSKQDLDKAKASKGLAPMGIVGQIACPIVVNTLLGFATNSIPVSWGCSASTSAASLGAVITSACEAAIPL
jgi:hypothetical protein